MMSFLAGIMAKSLNRIQFLRGDFKGELPIRPPWSKCEDEFTELCTRCDDCIKACPQNILHRGPAGFPEVNFSKSGCDYCQVCADVCQTQAIAISASNQSSPWNISAAIKNNCLSERGIVCRSCGDVCDMRAIRFRLALGGRAFIDFDVSACNGCGECVSLCPVAAIGMQHNDQVQESQ